MFLELQKRNAIYPIWSWKIRKYFTDWSPVNDFFSQKYYLQTDMGKYNKTLHYNNQQSKLYWVEAPYNNFWCWLFWGTLHTTFKNVVVGLVLVGTKNYNFVK